METVLFFVLAVLAVGAAVGVIAQRSAVRSALFLLVHFCSLAGLYVLLNAQFVALVQVLIYAGAVVVLFLFVVMLLGVERAEEPPDVRHYQQGVGALLALLFLAGTAWAVLTSGAGPGQALGQTGSVRAIGAAFATGYAVPFELASVLLLVAIVGAIVLAKSRWEG